MNLAPKHLADSLLEGTIIGSFTKVGYEFRSKLFDWEPVEEDLSGQVMVLTGGSSGIGKAMALRLLQLGAEVHFTSRRRERAEEVANDFNAMVGTTGAAFGHALDTGDLDSVRAFAEEIRGLPGGIDVLLSNAGALTADYRTDDRGMELTLSSHLVGPYLLMKELKESFRPGARVLIMSSGGMYTQGLDVDEIELSEADYKGAIAYAKAKRGQVELVAALGPVWATDGITVQAVHPGWVATAGVDSGLPGFGKVMGPLLRNAAQGADTMVWLAATGGGNAAPGQFWLDRSPRRTSYIPGTGTDDAERQKLITWLDDVTKPAIAA